MPIHVAILFRKYIEMILAGTKTVESRLTITPRPPYRTINPGEVIYFKASSGPFMASAVAAAVEFHDGLTPAKVAGLQKKWNPRVRGDDEYWRWKRNSRYATFIELRGVRAIAPGAGPNIPPSRGPAWFTLDDTMAPKPLEVLLTAGAIRNGYVPAPPGMKAGDGKIHLMLPDGRAVETDVYARRFRWRGWRGFFQSLGLRAGDRVRLEPIGPRKYRVSFVNAAAPPSPKGRGGTSPDLFTFITEARLKTLIHEARDEDLGPSGLDITSKLLTPANATARAVIRSRKLGRLSGCAVLPYVIEAYDLAIQLTPHLHDGDRLDRGSRVAELSGSLRSILAVERVALNFLTHLSGIATLSARFVEETAGTGAKIYDTRKTHPGLRELEKYAVVCGGGHAHRMGLFDAVLVKDNHIAHLSLDKLAPALAEMVAKARTHKPRPSFIMVEVDSLAQLHRVLPLGIDIVLLDNMTPVQIILQAVARPRRRCP